MSVPSGLVGAPQAGVALYLRVSTEEQDLEGQSRELRAYAAARGWTVVESYREKASAAGHVERTMYRRLLVDAGDPGREWSHVLVWALDRWSREPSFVKAVGSIEELEAQGISWHSFKEPQLDTGSGDAANLTRDLLRGILSTIATFEARRRSDRTRVSMQEIKSGRRPTRSGRPVGRPRRVTPELVAKAEALRKQDLRWAEVGQRLGTKGETLRRAVFAARKQRMTVQNP